VIYRKFGVLAACVLPVVAAAEVSYNYGEIGYVETEIDTGFGDIDGDGFFIAGSFEFTDNYFFYGDYTGSNVGFFDVSTLGLGVGFHTTQAAPAQFVIKGGLLRAEVDAGILGDESETGYGISVGGRGELSPAVEWDLFADYADLDDADTGVSGALRFDVTSTFAVGLNAASGDDVTNFGLHFRWLPFN